MTDRDQIHCYNCGQKSNISALDLVDPECPHCYAPFPEAQIASKFDPYGAYNSAGECIGRIRCGCEDYPCCGH